MDKKEFLKQRIELENEIVSIEKKLVLLEKQYIESNTTIPSGQDVLIKNVNISFLIGGNDLGRKVFLKKYEVDLMGRITPILYGYKRDQSLTKRPIQIFDNQTICFLQKE